jgi:hypothetical protein
VEPLGGVPTSPLRYGLFGGVNQLHGGGARECGAYWYTLRIFDDGLVLVVQLQCELDQALIVPYAGNGAEAI